MLLAIDIGNSNVKLGVWQADAWQAMWRLPTRIAQTADEYGLELTQLLGEFAAGATVERVVLASGVPALTGIFVTVSERYLGRTPYQVTAATAVNLPILTDNPTAVGADRIANAVAAHQQWPGPSIVIDMGTATTLDAIDATGAFLGGVICPGLKVTADALANRAAQLGPVALEAPPNVLGTNTIHAIQSGLIFGTVSLLEGVTQRLQQELNWPALTVIGTGGLVPLIADQTTLFNHIDLTLTLTGLRLLSERASR